MKGTLLLIKLRICIFFSCLVNQIIISKHKLVVELAKIKWGMLSKCLTYNP